MNSEVCVRQTADGVILAVAAVPRSCRTEIIDIHQERCRIKIKAPPVDGEANTALIEVLAKAFGLPRKSVIQISGHKGKHKSFLLTGLNRDLVCEILEKILQEKSRARK